ncbi:Xaa-Pro peptidase family protein [Sphingosinicella sp. BN140058]|uniref:M24 family metallopeptidase n=1 Tax=Sphingosinicella sp. BN140058 TaxID=1892855 RepID=UPI0010105F12|nr:Xaa-Pro peptidase family protein [Sphingosinicella sp. BN140058]QAY78758.1 aminopeptidase P family protein [Sphingosinicella sp. BN140058]
MTIGGATIEAELAAIRPWADVAPAIDAEERQMRLERARALTEAAGADALLVNAGASLRYFTGLAWSLSERMVALLLPLSGPPAIVCPAFERGSLEAGVAIAADLLLWEEDEDPIALVRRTLPRGATLAVDPLLPFQWGERLRAGGLEVIDGAAAIDGCRKCKSGAELKLLAQAKAMTLEVHRRAARILSPGMAASTVTKFIDDAHRAIGGGGSTFCIVQFGRATAFPHGLPGEQYLEEDQLVLIDTGCRVEGYHSDITRTYAFGRATDEERMMWALEKEAQAAAFAAARPGTPCEEVDAAARRVLEAAGLGPGYRLPGLPHRTGHGIGLSIHEPAYLVRGDRTPLSPGMCFSNEPMIVVPGKFGIRLEDHFHVTEDGAAWFTEPQTAIDRPFG